MLGRLWCGPFPSFRPRERLFGPGLMTPVFLRQLCRMEPDGLLRHVVYLGITTEVSCGFVVCDRGSGGSCFFNARRLQSINSKSIMAGRRSFISRSTSHVSAGIWSTSAEIV